MARIQREDGRILFVRKNGEHLWRLPETKAILFEDPVQAAVRAARPWVEPREIRHLEPVGLSSDPQQGDVYAYAVVVRADLPLGAKVHLDVEGYEASWMDPMDHSEVPGIALDNPRNVRRIDLDEERSMATRSVHLELAAMGQVQPTMDVSGILKMYDNEHNFIGILLAEKATGPGKGKWDGLGGYPEHGEDAQHALLREIREETGLVGRAQRRFLRMKQRRHDKRGGYPLDGFLGSGSDG